MIRDNYEVEILVNGKPVKEYYHEGRYYIEGKKGTSYSLRVKNNGFSRILVVPSVDGLSVVDGKPASRNSAGYIVNGYNSVTIDGWRTSDKEVAEFIFSSPGDSYANRKGEGKNLGVIGCAIFREKQNYNLTSIFDTPFKPFIDEPWTKPFFGAGHYTGGTTQDIKYRVTSANLNTGEVKSKSFDNGKVEARCYNMYSDAGMVPQSQDVGTGFGDIKKSEITKVYFDREDSPISVFELFYNTRQQLEKMGIDLMSRPQYVTPSAFPADDDGYCKPPKK